MDERIENKIKLCITDADTKNTGMHTDVPLFVIASLIKFM